MTTDTECNYSGDKNITLKGLCVWLCVRACLCRADLSAMCSWQASRASLLSVFHMASVSGDISRVSRKAVALENTRTCTSRAEPGGKTEHKASILCCRYRPQMVCKDKERQKSCKYRGNCVTAATPKFNSELENLLRPFHHF